MFSARTAAFVAEGYLPNKRLIYEQIMNETRAILVNLEGRFQTFSQQQVSFVTALDRCRKTAFEPTRKISTLAQVYNYAECVSDNRTDKRIFSIFFKLARDLNEFRRTLVKLAKPKGDERLNKVFAVWKQALDDRQDISAVRARFPYCHVNHLSCDEARNHFGGIVSVLPVAMECAREAVERIEVIRAYRSSLGDNNGRCSVHSSRPITTRVPDNSKAASRQQQQESRLISAPSPSVSSPLSSHTPSQISLRASASATALARNGGKSSSLKKEKARPGSAYAMQVAAKKHETASGANERPSTAAATQTPRFLAATLKPELDWPHHTISEAEMRKLLKQKKNALTRPEWKP